MTFTLTREQLYDLVWSEPMQHLAKQIGISDVAIAKHCRKLGVPVPERGYWNKLQAGKPVTKAALPERDLVTINRVTISGTLTPALRGRIKGEPGMAEASAESIEALTERLRKRLGRVAVPRDFSRAHPAIATLLQKDEKLRQEAAKSPYRFPWDQPKFDAPFERRRLLFLNGLFLGFAKVGGRGWMRGNDARELAIYMGDSSVSFELGGLPQGKSTGRVAPASKGREVLCLTIPTAHQAAPGISFSWRDEDGRRLEQQLADIIIGMAVAGEHLQRKWLEEQAAWRRKREEEAAREEERRKAEEQRRERERVAALEKARRDALRRDAKAWREANDIRAYVEALRTASDSSDTMESWARWALNEADKIDPIASGRALQLPAEGQDNDGHDDK